MEILPRTWFMERCDTCPAAHDRSRLFAINRWLKNCSTSAGILLYGLSW